MVTALIIVVSLIFGAVIGAAVCLHLVFRNWP